MFITSHPVFLLFSPRSWERRREQSCQVCVCRHRPQQHGEEAPGAHHLPPHCWQQQHAAQLWWGGHNYLAYTWREGRLDVRRNGKEWKVSLDGMFSILQMWFPKQLWCNFTKVSKDSEKVWLDKTILNYFQWSYYLPTLAFGLHWSASC